MVANRGFKFKIIPTREQSLFFDYAFGCARFVYNQTIDFIDCSLSYELDIPKASVCDAVLRNSFPFLKQMDSVALQQERRHAYDAYMRYFKKKASKPVFKAKHHSRDSYTTVPNHNNIRIEVIDGKTYIRLPKVGFVRIKMHRQLPKDYTICEVTVSKYLNRYIVSIIIRYDMAVPTPKTKVSESAICGLDYNQAQMVVSNVPLPYHSAPKYYLNTMNQLAKLQQRLSHCIKGSNNYNKVQNKLQKLHRHIANQRYDFLHKLSTYIANTYDVVVVEDIDLHKLSTTHHMGRTLMDNGFQLWCYPYRTRYHR